MVSEDLRRRSSASSASPSIALIFGGLGTKNGIFTHIHDTDSGDESDEDEGKRRSHEVDLLNEGSNRLFKIKTPIAGERWKWWKVYAMHFLFMWNSRTYEYVSVSRLESKLSILSKIT